MGEHCARERQSLALTAGKAHALLADASAQTPREVTDELSLSDLDGRVDLGVRRVRPTQGQVLPNGHGEQRGVLERGGDDLTKLAETKVAYVHAVDGDGTGGHVVQAGDQLGQHRLSRTGGTDDREGFARCDVEIDVMQDIGVRVREAEADTVEAHPALDR